MGTFAFSSQVLRSFALCSSIASLHACGPQQTQPKSAEKAEIFAGIHRLHLPPGSSLRLAGKPCDELIVHLEEGEVSAAERDISAGGALGIRIANETLLLKAKEDSRLVIVHAPAPSEQCEKLAPLIKHQPERYSLKGGKLRVAIFFGEGELKRASFSILAADADVGVPEHIHDKSEEWLLIDDGAGEMRRADETVPIAAGEFVAVPANTVHDYAPRGIAKLRAYQAYVPPGPEARFRIPAKE